jgi:L-fuconolactonase
MDQPAADLESGPAIVDCHQHFWDISRFTYPWMPPGPGVLRRTYLPEDLLSEIRAACVRQTVVVEALDCAEETRFLLELASCHPWIAGVVGWVDLTDPLVGRSLEKLATNPKLVGIRHQVESEPDEQWLIRPTTLRGLGELAAFDLPFDLVVYPKHLKLIPVVADEVPDLRMVLDHLGKPPIASREMEPWQSEVNRISQIPRLMCKISGLVTEAGSANPHASALRPYVDHIVREFSSRRIMWGSDWPVCLKVAPYSQVFQQARELLGGLGKVEEDSFWGGTARAFYRLKA